MLHQIQKLSRNTLLLAVFGACGLLVTSARAGDIYLTGHDVLLHSGQANYDTVILDYLRGSTAKASYSIGVVGTVGSGFARFTGQGSSFTGGAAYHSISLSGALTGYASATFYDAATLAADGGRAAILAGLDVLIVESHVNCGGCSLTTAGSNALNTMAGDIATAFNAGMDIWGQSGANLGTYYNFLPASAVAAGAPIGGSSGFTATAAGLGIGIANGMINGYPTHNRFASQAPAFTTFEVRGAEIISIGLKGGTIGGGVITVPDSGSSLLLLGMALLGLAVHHRKLRA